MQNILLLLLIIIIMSTRLGRRLPVCSVHVVVGVCLLGHSIIYIIDTDAVDLTAIIMTLALLGKMGISATFCLIIPYTKELVPTNIRCVN